MVTSLDGVEERVKVLDWDGEGDLGNPYNWSSARKWTVAGAALFSTFIVSLNGTSVTVAATEINKEFHIHDSAYFSHSFWPVTSWSLGGAAFIIIGLPMIEDTGICIGFLATYCLFFLMVIPQAVAKNFTTLLVTRFLSGGCVSLLANIIASVIPDLWEDDRARSFPVGLYILMYLGGTTIGPPLFTGVMQHTRNWRWIFIIQLIIYGACFPFFYFLIRETRASVILEERAKQIRKETGERIYAVTANELSARTRLLRSIKRPIYLLMTEPVLFASTLWSAFSFGTVFLFTQSVTQVFGGLYGWTYGTGYVQAAVVIGELLGWCLSLSSVRIYLRSARSNMETPGQPVLEARLYHSVWASFGGIVGGMLVYAWTSSPNIIWVAPAVGLTLVGFGIQVVVTAVTDYVTDAYAASGYAASAVSAVACGENIFAAFLPLASQSLYTRLGYHWASTLLALLALLLGAAPVVFMWKGQWFREKSRFMQNSIHLSSR
ncbi:MFS general substrate transporter [Piedraia hortae CBS 480.64]|uniref:MFS general substrate transporter n=1 Tax=Piedraia hortae CBS 480.64 TaxID=1314780 RepID=A0A6A7BYF4_9PEZI|nr:MFS general substrate transporter [Piedraia hortae CBS 480.64]